MTGRLDYPQSCAKLRALGLLGAGEHPVLLDRMPQYDDPEPLGVSLLRMLVADADLSALTLPRTFAARSEFERTLFVGSDFSQSNLCWNDFVDCSFVEADLSAADLRASIFTRVRFDRADLSGADLRRSVFEGCSFTDANMQGAILTARQGEVMVLSAGQRSQIAWTSEEGPEPDGG